jgi:hypothetical protein
MRVPYVALQFIVWQAGFREMLDPFQAKRRRKVWRGSQAGLHLEHFVCDVAHLEGVARFVAIPAADREHFSADFPNMMIAPLDDICRRG